LIIDTTPSRYVTHLQGGNGDSGLVCRGRSGKTEDGGVDFLEMMQADGRHDTG